MKQASVSRVADVAALAGVVISLLLIALQWHSLPTTVPIHFGIHGEPNRYGSRSWLFLPVGVSVLLFGLFSVIRRSPGVFNLPAPPGSPERPAQEALAVQLLAVVGALVVWIQLYVTLLMVAVAQGKGRILAHALVPLTLAGSLLPIAWFVVRVRSRRG